MLKYFILDVFTKERLQGNPLAVVTGADRLSDARMLAIAAEFNLSETVFVSQPRIETHHAALRIFTPRRELPFAGHPTIGTAVLIGLQQRASGVRLEERVGTITCVMERVDRRTGYARFALPVLPEEAGEMPELARIAEPLGIEAADIGFGDYAPSVWSAGVPYYLVPVRDREVLGRLIVERRGWPEIFPLGHNAVYAFTATTGGECDFAARLFSPAMPTGEDPATGSAAAALLGLIARHQTFDDGQRYFSLSQGTEMGRPSRIDLSLRLKNGALDHAGIGGNAVLLAEGQLDA